MHSGSTGRLSPERARVAPLRGVHADAGVPTCNSVFLLSPKGLQARPRRLAFSPERPGRCTPGAGGGGLQVTFNSGSSLSSTSPPQRESPAGVLTSPQLSSRLLKPWVASQVRVQQPAAATRPPAGKSSGLLQLPNKGTSKQHLQGSGRSSPSTSRSPSWNPVNPVLACVSLQLPAATIESSSQHQPSQRAIRRSQELKNLGIGPPPLTPVPKVRDPRNGQQLMGSHSVQQLTGSHSVQNLTGSHSMPPSPALSWRELTGGMPLTPPAAAPGPPVACVHERLKEVSEQVNTIESCLILTEKAVAARLQRMERLAREEAAEHERAQIDLERRLKAAMDDLGARKAQHDHLKEQLNEQDQESVRFREQMEQQHEEMQSLRAKLTEVTSRQVDLAEESTALRCPSWKEVMASKLEEQLQLQEKEFAEHNRCVGQRRLVLARKEEQLAELGRVARALEEEEEEFAQQKRSLLEQIEVRLDNQRLSDLLVEQQAVQSDLERQLRREQVVSSFLTPGLYPKEAKRREGDGCARLNIDLRSRQACLEEEVRKVHRFNVVLRKELPCSSVSCFDA